LKLITDILGKLILVIIILVFCGYAAAVSPEPIEEDDHSLSCKFPCKFPDPVYRLLAKSAKYEWIEKHGKIQNP